VSEEACRAALQAIAEIQPRTLQTLREAGVVFDRAPLPPTGDAASVWQNIAFWIYTALCEADAIARGMLNE